ncbi:MAG: TonB-dependent receptor [Burkholderiales bacterium]|nr:TonB-dependent receptor [Anaerolineae bacterium]
MQAVYSLPGIIQTQEIGGAPAVRGSGPDDNAFLIDFLPAGYVFHDFGFSIFNENLLRDFGVKSAGFGSRYGKATGAIFDVTLREPRQQPWSYTVDASFLRVGASAEGQITDSQAMYVSVRESLIHLLLKLRAETIEEEEDISFRNYPRARDFQLKYSWLVDEHNRISFLGIGAQDETAVSLGNESDIALIDPGVAGEARLKTRFVSEGVNWLYTDDVNRLQTAVGHLDEARHLSSGNGAEFSNTDSNLLTIKSHYTRQAGKHHALGLGGEYQRARYDYDLRFRFRSCTNFTPDCRVNRGPLISARDSITVNTTEAFVEDRWQLIDPVAVTFGAHATHNDYLDETYVEPRVAAEWQLNAQWSTHASWGKYHQLPRVGQMVPTLGNPTLVSPSATHYVVGVTQKLDHGWSWNTDVYYKELDNLIVDVASGEQYVNRATGTAYGAELMINKNRDERAAIRGANRWYGWLALSLAKAKRHNELNNNTSRFEYDTPVVANLVASYRINKALDAGLRWQFRSGLPYTPIVGNTPNPSFPGFFLPLYGDLNSSRASPYHRLDVRVEYQLNLRKLQGSVYADIINIYARRNGGAAQYKPVPGSSDYTLEEEESLPFLPSVGIKLTF